MEKNEIIIPIENLLEREKFVQEFTCVICLEFVYRPLHLKCCDHLVCTVCLKKYIRTTSNSKKCALCKSSLKYSEPNRIMKRIYLDMNLKCLNLCGEIIKFENYFSHVYNDCRNSPKEKFYCPKCCDIYPIIMKSIHYNCLINNLIIKENKLHGHCLKFTNMRKHIDYEKYGWICDFCEKEKNPFEKSHHCKKCRLDICYDCVEFVKNKSPIENLHCHELILDRVVDWRCNICNRKGNFCMAWSCIVCDFDICIKCYWCE